LNFKQFSKLSKLEITMLIDIVAIAAFLSVPDSFGRILFIIPLIVSGTLASMSASIINNAYDTDIDTEMKRTSYRNEIINPDNRAFYAGIATVMLGISMAVSYYFLNLLTMLFILGGFLSYVFLYTIFLKRRTTWNIVIGGIAGSFPALAGWAALMNDVSPTSLFIAFLVFLWTPTHFWSLATGNLDDYRNANVPMLPAVVGIKKGGFWILANTVVLVAYSIIPFVIPSIVVVGSPYYFIAAIMDVMMIYYVAKPYFGNSGKGYRAAFHFSNMYLLLILVSIWFAHVTV